MKRTVTAKGKKDGNKKITKNTKDTSKCDDKPEDVNDKPEDVDDKPENVDNKPGKEKTDVKPTPASANPSSRSSWAPLQLMNLVKSLERVSQQKRNEIGAVGVASLHSSHRCLDQETNSPSIDSPVENPEPSRTDGEELLSIKNEEEKTSSNIPANGDNLPQRHGDHKYKIIKECKVKLLKMPDSHQPPRASSNLTKLPPVPTPGRSTDDKVEMVFLPLDDPRSLLNAQSYPHRAIRTDYDPPDHPHNLFFRVNGAITMPVLSVEHFRKLVPPYPTPSIESDSDNESDFDYSILDDEEAVLKIIKSMSPTISTTTSDRSQTADKILKKKQRALPLKTKSSKNKDNHVAVDKEKAIISCKICQKTFGFPSRLAMHMISHSGVKPFSCTKCDTRFTTKTNLNHHMRFVRCEKRKNVND